MPTYVTPGVHYERVDASDAKIAPLRTDIVGFVGIARRGPLNTAIPVESWRQFVTQFGDFTGAGYLGYAVRGFFETGGRRCWVVRVASDVAASARIELAVGYPPPAAIPAWIVEASSPGVWGNDVDILCRETHRAQTVANDLAAATGEYVTVQSVTGFERGTHVRVLVQPGVPEYRAVAAVDPDRKRLYWVNPRREFRLEFEAVPYERPLNNYDPTRPLVIESIEYTLLIREAGRLVAVIRDLSLVPGHPRYGPRVLPPGADGGQVVLHERRNPLEVAQLWPLAEVQEPLPCTGGLDGLAALTVRDFIGEPAHLFDDFATRQRKERGLRALEQCSEVALVAIPDIHIQPAAPRRARRPPPCEPDPCLLEPLDLVATPRERSIGDLPPRFTTEQVFAVQQALIEHCTALDDRFALLDPPFDAVRDPRLGIGPMRAWRQRFDTDRAALYAPWLRVPDPLRLDPSGLRDVPPTGHVAGLVAKTDRELGVHRAPANGALHWVQDVTLPIDDDLHGVLNPEHVNATRAFAGRGIRVFGARTLSSDSDWRFVNVRRLMLMLKKAIRLGCQWATFEPNNHFTRAKLQLALTSLLLQVWQRGALAGKTAAESFYVRCGDVENPAYSRDRGMLVAEVGVAPAKPYEFIVVRVGVSDNALEVTETGALEVVP